MAGRNHKTSTDKVRTIQTALQASHKPVEPTDILTNRQLEAFGNIVAELSYDEVSQYSVRHNVTQLAMVIIAIEDMWLEIEKSGYIVQKKSGPCANPLLTAIERMQSRSLALYRSLSLAGATADRDPAKTRERRERLRAQGGTPRSAGDDVPESAGKKPVHFLENGQPDWTRINEE